MGQKTLVVPSQFGQQLEMLYEQCVKSVKGKHTGRKRKTSKHPTKMSKKNALKYKTQQKGKKPTKKTDGQKEMGFTCSKAGKK